jgi:hypothetical protein
MLLAGNNDILFLLLKCVVPLPQGFKPATSVSLLEYGLVDLPLAYRQSGPVIQATHNKTVILFQLGPDNMA